MRKAWKVEKDSEVTDLQVKLSVMWHIWGNDCVYMNGWWEVCENVRKRATTRDANQELPWETVRSFLSFLTQPFPSFSSPYFPRNLSLLHLALPFSICPTSFASLQLPGVPLVVILLSVKRKRPWNTWKFRFLSYHSLPGQWKLCQHQKVCVLVYTCVYGCEQGCTKLDASV